MPGFEIKGDRTLLHRFTLALKGDRATEFRRKNRAGAIAPSTSNITDFNSGPTQATAKPNAHIAYLRHGRLHTLTADHFSELAASVSTLANRLVKGDFTPNPSEASCGICPYGEVCEAFYGDVETG